MIPYRASRAPIHHEESADIDFYYTVASQIQEMELVRGKIFQLEQTHMSMKQKYATRPRLTFIKTQVF